MNEWQQRVIALAAVAQAAAAVKTLARRGKLDDSYERQALLNSVLVQNPDSFATIYGDVSKLKVGLRVLLAQLGTTRDKDIETTRYIVGVLALARRIQRQPKAFAKLGERIEQLHRQQHQFQFEQETIYTGMASTYSDCISPLGRPIQIHGKPEFLQQQPVQNQIRSLLLAAIRSAVLWRQVGGKRRHFLFSRTRMIATANELLRALSSQSESSE